ncbi:hypothetical protein GS421_11310 [Rhodococcus hoagii]|nr:hypothetical protein [Prescottella equi]
MNGRPRDRSVDEPGARDRADPNSPSAEGAGRDGGAFEYPGNTTPVAEWNISVDPEAAARGCSRRSPPSARTGRPSSAAQPDRADRADPGPRSAVRGTRRQRPDRGHRATDPPGLRYAASNTLVRHVCDAVRFYFEFQRDHAQGFIAHLHDPFAAAVALDPSIATYRAPRSMSKTRGGSREDRRSPIVTDCGEDHQCPDCGGYR